ncbi:hypothetical protein QBC43DRAFT_339661 [Cladorrhinum sp. PSN259]|nr:hypothetical protein QBC43DRAFT_339661 [Cladorrhinum sp. PSN259]
MTTWLRSLLLRLLSRLATLAGTALASLSALVTMDSFVPATKNGYRCARCADGHSCVPVPEGPMREAAIQMLKAEEKAHKEYVNSNRVAEATMAEVLSARSGCVVLGMHNVDRSGKLGPDWNLSVKTRRDGKVKPRPVKPAGTPSVPSSASKAKGLEKLGSGRRQDRTLGQLVSSSPAIFARSVLSSLEQVPSIQDRRAYLNALISECELYREEW